MKRVGAYVRAVPVDLADECVVLVELKGTRGAGSRVGSATGADICLVIGIYDDLVDLRGGDFLALVTKLIELSPEKWR